MRLAHLLLVLLLAGTAAAAPPAPVEPAAPAGGLSTPCPRDMRHVRGVHYEQLQRLCSDYRGTHCFAFLPGLVLKEPRITPIDVCIDQYEWPNRRGARPAVMMSFVEAEAQCRDVGKRLCTEFEWELACEGPHHQPFPYGFAKRPGACNVDRPYRPYAADKLISANRQVRSAETSRLYQGAAAGAQPDCRSPFEVLDMVGNVEEWVRTSRPQWPFESSLKGGYWTKPWAGCRGTNERHAPGFRFYQIGFRCCRAPDGSPAPSAIGHVVAPLRRSSPVVEALLPTAQSVGYTSLPSLARCPSTPLAYLGRLGSSPGL